MPALERALGNGKPACVNVMTDPDAIAPITLAMYAAFKPSDERKETKGDRVAMPYYGEGDT